MQVDDLCVEVCLSSCLTTVSGFCICFCFHIMHVGCTGTSDRLIWNTLLLWVFYTNEAKLQTCIFRPAMHCEVLHHTRVANPVLYSIPWLMWSLSSIIYVWPYHERKKTPRSEGNWGSKSNPHLILLFWIHRMPQLMEWCVYYFHNCTD